MMLNNSSSTNESNQTCPEGLRDVDIKAILGMNSVSSFLSITGNLLVLGAIYKTTSLQSVTNYFIASLSMASLMVGVCVGPLYTARAVLHGRKISFNTAVTEVVSTALLETTLLNLCVVSIDRFLAITDVFHYHERMTPKRCRYLIAFCWIMAAVLALGRLVVSDATKLVLYYGVGVFPGVVMPFAVIIYCYIQIFKVARHQSKRIEAITVATTEQRLTTKRNNKAAWTIAIVVGLFLLFWTPVTGIGITQLLVTDGCLLRIMTIQWYWGVAFACYNPACNPWVFALRHREFKEAYGKIFRNVLLGRS